MDELNKLSEFLDSKSVRVDGFNRMRASVWKCSKCGKVFEFNDAVPSSACSPCDCDSIFFTKVRS